MRLSPSGGAAGSWDPVEPDAAEEALQEAAGAESAGACAEEAEAEGDPSATPEEPRDEQATARQGARAAAQKMRHKDRAKRFTEAGTERNGRSLGGMSRGRGVPRSPGTTRGRPRSIAGAGLRCERASSEKVAGPNGRPRKRDTRGTRYPILLPSSPCGQFWPSSASPKSR